MKEQKTELRGGKIAGRAGYIGHKLTGGTGEPDELYVKQGRCFYVEWKKEGKPMRIKTNQHQWADRIKANGTTHHFCNDLDDFLQILIEFEQENFQ